MKQPVVHVFAVCKNEIEFLPFFFQHYQGIAEQIVIYDNQSTDGSREFIAAQPNGVLRSYDTKGELRDDTHRLIKNSVWKESIGLADWVIVSDLDEIVYHHDLTGCLNECQALHVSIPSIIGFNMISETYPKAGIPITQQVRHGAYSKAFTKHVVFDPNRIREINFSPGGHRIEPEGDVRFGKNRHLKLLHYKYLGGPARMQPKWDAAGQTLNQIAYDNGWGLQYGKPTELSKRYEYVKRHAEQVIFDKPPSLGRRLFNVLKRDRKPYI